MNHLKPWSMPDYFPLYSKVALSDLESKYTIATLAFLTIN